MASTKQTMTLSTRDLHLKVQVVSMRVWGDFIDQCLFKRVGVAKFDSSIPHIRSKHPLPPDALADLLLRPRAGNRDCLDPRIPMYLEAAYNRGYVEATSILSALYRYSTSHTQSQSQSQSQSHSSGAGNNKLPPVRWRSSYGFEEVLFYRLTKAVVQGPAVQRPADALRMMEMMARWMALFTAASSAFAADVMSGLGNTGPKEEMESARAAFVALLISVGENPILIKTVGRPIAKRVRKDLLDTLVSFIPTLQNAQVAERLEVFRATLASFEPVPKSKDAAAKGMEELLDSTVGLDNAILSELPIANSRAGLYIYLDACFVGRPLLDDHALFTYLHNRYHGDVQSAAIDLILASFDVLANAVFKHNNNQAAHLLRSYLINKIPLLLVALSHSMFPPATPEYCITEALNQVDTNIFPTLSSMFDDSRNNNPVTDNVREEFCFACCLHNLMPQSHIETLLGENTYQTLPSGGRYVKDNLVRDCIADPEKIQSLIGELDNMDGNVGAVCQALTEVLGQLCANRETMTLKMLCSQLARRPLGLDVMLLFVKPASILQPICDLLDNWRYEEDQGEYQPVYEEFGSILLLLLAFAYRYNLTAAGIGIRSRDSFVAKLLSQGHLSRPLEELTEQEKGHLNGWIHGLFDTDAGGLGDELMSSCPPQDFYLLMPTLFQNVALAFGSGCLTEERLKGGLEYLVDIFLLPSLVTAIRFLSDYLCNDQVVEQKAVIKILQLLLAPNAISPEASTMLQSVLNLVAKPLEHALRTYQRRDPGNVQIEPLLRALKDSLPLSRRTGGSEHEEIESWLRNNNGELTAAAKQTIQGLVSWSLRLHPDMNNLPAPYTHRLVLCGVRKLGARRMLHVILEEIQQHSEAGNGSVVFDVATALVCAPDAAGEPLPATGLHSLDEAGGMPPAPQAPMSLREALKAEAEGFRKIQARDPMAAEAVVRLYRKVQDQMAPAQTQMLPADLAADMAASLDDSAAVQAAAVAVAGQQDPDPMQLDGVGLDLMGPTGGDISLGGSTNGGSLDLNDDIFNGLDAGGDPFDGWDSMDLGGMDG